MECSSSEISLRHGEFEDTGHANGTCNGGDIFARITRDGGDRFTSQLIVNTSLDMNGREIECAVDDGRDRTPVGASMITLTTGWCRRQIKIIIEPEWPIKGQIALNHSDSELASNFYNVRRGIIQ